MLQNGVIRFPLHRKCDDKKVDLNFLFPLFVLRLLAALSCDEGRETRPRSWVRLWLSHKSFIVCKVESSLNEVFSPFSGKMLLKYPHCASVAHYTLDWVHDI